MRKLSSNCLKTRAQSGSSLVIAPIQANDRPSGFNFSKENREPSNLTYRADVRWRPFVQLPPERGSTSARDKPTLGYLSGAG
jgi:hypothetical protein